MGLNFGNINATSGMSKAIYQEINTLLSPPLQLLVDNSTGDARLKSQEALDKARIGWQKLSYAIAKGVIEHIVSNMVINDIKTTGKVKTTVKGDTADANYHHHYVDLSGEQDYVEFKQSNNGTGHIQ